MLQHVSASFGDACAGGWRRSVLATTTPATQVNSPSASLPLPQVEARRLLYTCTHVAMLWLSFVGLEEAAARAVSWPCFQLQNDLKVSRPSPRMQLPRTLRTWYVPWYHTDHDSDALPRLQHLCCLGNAK